MSTELISDKSLGDMPGTRIQGEILDAMQSSLDLNPSVSRFQDSHIRNLETDLPDSVDDVKSRAMGSKADGRGRDEFEPQQTDNENTLSSGRT